MSAFCVRVKVCSDCTMSPAPQGNLEVEHYIGSCLISARVPSQSNNPAKNQQPNNIITVANRHPNHYQNFYHSGKAKGNDVAGDNRLVRQQQGFVNKVQQRPDSHVQGSRYSALPLPMAAAAECNAFPNSGHYIQTARHHHHSGSSGSGWAGMPLISMTSGNARRNKNKGGGPPASANHKAGQKHAQFNKNKELEGGAESDCCRSPLSRLAIHTQGAPLIQANRYSNHNRNRNNNYNRGDPQVRLYGGGDMVVRRLDAAKDTSKSGSTNIQTTTTTTTSTGNNNSDSLSVASDESSGNSENSLPRIIKPRKRRKKDRKPPPAAVSSTSSSSSAAAATAPSPSSSTVPSNQLPSDENLSPVEEKSSVVTLQPYLPLCFDSYENPITELPTIETVQARLCTDKQLEDLTASVVDEFPFGNLLDDEDDAKSELSSCAPATLCQCRYCDPSGVIWDVDQRCYSPFLTPPSPTDKIPFSKSLPVFLDPAVTSYRKQVPSYTLNDFGTMLRRSWSDPSSDINMGITRLFGHDSSSSSERNGEEQSVAQLQVSSEIVTSPNGHRDIEIKFYSSPCPASSVPKWPKQVDVISTDKLSSASSLVSTLLDCDTNDRLFVVEE